MILEGCNMSVHITFDLLISAIDNIADFDGEKQTSHLSIEPKLTIVPFFFSRFQKAATDRQPLSTLMMDLRLSEEELLRQMKPKGRYNIKVAEKYQVEVVRYLPQEGLKTFLNLYLPLVKRNGFEGKDADYFERLIYVLSQEYQGEFFFAKYKSHVLAAALVVYCGNTATFLFGASNDKERQTMAQYELHWSIMKYAKKSGYRWYDWYGVASGNDNVSHPWYGFSVFKKKFGGELRNYIGAYDFVYNQNLYKEYIKENE
jgi:lipid II:glycine glycyltransferase (peptidoglycan interpeptide bridge formation enzyme)